MKGIAEDAIHEVELALLSKGIQSIKKLVLYGDPAKEILKYITRISADLIVLSSSSSEVLPPHFIGKTAEKILTKVHVHALVYTPLSREPPGELESILLVISGLIPIKQALSLALSLAHRRGIKVSILSLVRLNSIDIELSKTYTWAFV